MPQQHDDEGPNIVDQVLRDGDDEMNDDPPERRDEEDEEGAYVRESGELNLNDNVGADDSHNEGNDRKRKERTYDTGAIDSSAPVDRKKEPTVCCTQCVSKNKSTGRACICQVPSKLRRGSLGRDGCFTCHCTGCHPDDLEGEKSEHREERPADIRSRAPIRADRVERIDRERPRSFERPERGDRERRVWGNDDEPLKNGCCRACMKAFSETKRACLCQVPFDVRLGVLPDTGCKICGCKGCHPEEAMMKKRVGLLPNRARQPPTAPRGYPAYPPLPAYYPPVSAPRHREDPHTGLLPYPIPHFTPYPPPSARDYDPYKFYERDPYRESRERLNYDREHERDRERDRDRRDSRDRDRGRDRERDLRALRDEREGHRDRRSEREYDREYDERSRTHYEREVHLSKRPRERDYHRSPPSVNKRIRGSPL